MKISELKSFLDCRLTVVELQKLLKTEVVLHTKARTVKGGSCPVYITEDESFIFTKEHFVVLCSTFFRDELDEYEIAYIADIILMADNIELENEVLEDNVAELTDPEINGKFTKERAQLLILAYTKIGNVIE